MKCTIITDNYCLLTFYCQQYLIAFVDNNKAPYFVVAVSQTISFLFVFPSHTFGGAGEAAGAAARAVSGLTSWWVCGRHRQPILPAEHCHHRDRQHHPEGRQGAGPPQLWHGLHPDGRHHQREWRYWDTQTEPEVAENTVRRKKEFLRISSFAHKSLQIVQNMCWILKHVLMSMSHVVSWSNLLWFYNRDVLLSLFLHSLLSYLFSCSTATPEDH